MTSPYSGRPTHTPTAVAATATAEASATSIVEFKLVGGGQVKTGVIQVAVNIVWLNAVEPLVLQAIIRSSMIGANTSRRRMSN